ncbi:hypothetical protein NITMOv2_4716 [Nitrospira moscoviensis]|uniref:Uncharacterized protein n=1 Tax=Nitrospira moscoviensis TaxID=42253 RepID=A0A0K2GJG3_NITMO|nr:hypothetical protein NITMOv2_4716 [Nitrospira moscoviensis]
MPYTGSSHNKRTSAPSPGSGRPVIPHRELGRQLERQRAMLLNSTALSLAASDISETSADLADQAAMECAHDLALEVKQRTFKNCAGSNARCN